MKTKRCTKCQRDLAASDFPRHKQTRDGLQSNCYDCKAAWERERRRRDKAAGTPYRPSRRERDKLRARNLVNKAVSRGAIERPKSCERCAQQTRIHAHHADYSKPYEVMWLCPRCHGLEHRGVPA